MLSAISRGVWKIRPPSSRRPACSPRAARAGALRKIEALLRLCVRSRQRGEMRSTQAPHPRPRPPANRF